IYIVLIKPARLHTPRMKCTGIGTGINFAVFALPRQPDLQIVGFGGGENYVAATEGDHTVRQLKQLQDLLGVSGQFFQRLSGLLRDRKSTRLNSSHVKISYAVF